jgi:hypothetical protein
MGDQGARRGSDDSDAHASRKGLVITVALILAIPVVLGAVIGLFEINPVAAELYSSVGEDAHLLLNPFPDDSLVVEIAYQESVGPPPGVVVGTLEQRINETCPKATIAVDEHGFSSAATAFGDASLLALLEQQRHHWPVPGTMSLFYLYLGGNYAPDSSVIGLAFRASTIAVFESTITANPGVIGDPTGVTTTVFVHEFGHELGLVGIYGAAPNEDLAHPPHSNDPNDVMYWEVDTTRIGLLGGSPPTQFDTADLSDLTNVRHAVIPLEVLPWVVLAGCLIAAVVVVRTERKGRAPATPPGR